MMWCANPGQLLLGDFNGDKRTDMLCHEPTGGHKYVAFANTNGAFPGTSRDWPMGWCTTGGSLMIADLDGSGTSDFLCQAQSNGYKWTALQFP